MAGSEEDELLRSVAMQNAQSILAARQRAETELARSLAMMRATLESSTDGIVAVDDGGRLTAWNERFAQMWGASPELMEARDHARVVDLICGHFADPAACRAKIEEIRARALPESFDLLELADGRVLERFSRTQWIEGRSVGRVWTYRDITARRRAEEALREETRMLELLNRTGRALAGNLDLQTLVQAVTDAATEACGAKFGAFFYNLSGPKGESYMLYTLSGAPREAFEKFGLPRNTPVFEPTFRGTAIVRSADITLDPRYGKVGPHHGMPSGHLPVRSYLAVPVVSRSGGVIGGLFFGHPSPNVFTERDERLVAGIAGQAAVGIDNARLYDSERNARNEAERMSEMKDEFLATLSHELRTPLSAILGWAHVLVRRLPEPPDVRRGLEAIERNARVQTQLIEDLLDMSRITSGKVRLDIQPIAPVSFIEAAVETVRPAADAKGIRLETVLDPTAGPISGDGDRLQQVVWNLLSNAIKFTPKDGKVQVVLERVNSHIEVHVADNGVGIEPQFVPLVFDRFRQADSSTTRRFGGLGLGLSIVKHLVELHGGTVGIKSAGKDMGSTFTVRLPLNIVQRRGEGGERTHPRAAKAVATDYRVEDLSGLRVLVVDDEPDARDLLRQVLADCGAEVIAAGGAEDALRMVEAARPHVLVSDIGMPDVDGFELLRRVRALGEARGGKVPAIALTAFARSEDRTRALRTGFVVHVSKPVEPAELVATVASVAGRTDAP